MEIMTHDNDCCPECGLFLVSANNLSSSSSKEQQFLRVVLSLIALLLLVLTYIHYANFV